MRKNPRKSRLRNNTRFLTPLIFLPVLTGLFAIYYLGGSVFSEQLAQRGSDRLVTKDWQLARNKLEGIQPSYGTKYAYYRIKDGQNLAWVARHFSVSYKQLQSMNPGKVVYGTTIAVPPVESPLKLIGKPSTNTATLEISSQKGYISVNNRYKYKQYVTDIPHLMSLLANYDAINRISPKVYRIEKPLSIEGNIRLEITPDTVKELQLRSSPNYDITCLCSENAEVIIKDIKVDSIDPKTNKPDYDQSDGRSFIRALKSTRMDIIDSDISYLGNGLLPKRHQIPILRSGGTYGVSWRIPKGTLGQEIATGWVEGSRFHNNHFGSFTFGASGIMWKDNYFYHNEVYGLDPHDDSNNATITGNYFIDNGKHGFIVSKRCDYNVIKDNVSSGNKLHGFMLHQDSVYNVIENNISIGNTDNYAIYASSFNTIRNNKSYNARESNIRINAGSKDNFIQNNQLYGGARGIYAYDGDNGLLIENNIFKDQKNILTTNGADRVVFAGNTLDRLSYDVADNDRVIFGVNFVNPNAAIDMTPLSNDYESLIRGKG